MTLLCLNKILSPEPTSKEPLARKGAEFEWFVEKSGFIQTMSKTIKNKRQQFDAKGKRAEGAVLAWAVDRMRLRGQGAPGMGTGQDQQRGSR